GVRVGSEVSIHYDPMISKLAAWGRSRSEAIGRLQRALDEYRIEGIKTTLPFFRRIVRDSEFIAGHLDTGFISRYRERQSLERKEEMRPGDEAIKSRDVAMIAAALHYAQAKKQGSVNQIQPRESEERWRMSGRLALLDSKAAFDGGPTKK